MFLKRRIERLQLMVIFGMTLSAIGFYLTDSILWLFIHTVPMMAKTHNPGETITAFFAFINRPTISVALALPLNARMYRDEFVRITYMIVVFSILVQGLTIGKLAAGLEAKRKNVTL
ncbi:MAG: hypothetical protein ACXVJD_05430 [Mucilaginibacter sp.]